ncbi:hypothetical protein [Actinacidiphila yeochonensis]|uniref:hypothetical protein n=1 Tax=Actinacidiphila yeochonensis TaxID=89050 RepID=UPI001E34A254|nr:hypothetical protein [Actinacidiphila yeochonensis]
MPSAPGQPFRSGPVPARDRADACPGALRLHSADDGALARIRVPGGVLTSAQAAALGEAASRLGDGDLHLTSRGNVQLRGLGATCGGALEELLTAAGLLPSPAHERVRNVVASPLSGLDGLGHADIRPWLRALDALLCGSGPARALSGRFLFALDDGRGDVAALAPDVTLRAAPDSSALLRLGRAAPLGLPAAEAPRAALLAAEAFTDAARTEPTGEPGVWRVTELPDGGAALTERLARLLAASGVPVTWPAPTPGPGPWPAGPAPRPGLVRDPAAPGSAALSVLAPLGRLTPDQWRALADAASRTPAGELRLTPWRGAVVPAVPADRAPAELAVLAAAGLVTDESSPWAGVGACTGRPGCAKALADVRADAATTVADHAGTDRTATDRTAADRTATDRAATDRAATDRAATDRAAGQTASGGRLLPVYWSGCERACGRPRGDRVDVVATAEGYRVDLVRGGVPVTRGTAVPSAPTDPSASTDPSAPSDLAATVAAARRGAVSR